MISWARSSLALFLVTFGTPTGAETLTQLGAAGAPGAAGGDAVASSTSFDQTNNITAIGGMSGGPPGGGGKATAFSSINFLAAGQQATSYARAVGGDCKSTTTPTPLAAPGGDANVAAQGRSTTSSSLVVQAIGVGGTGSTGNQAVGGPGGEVTGSASGELTTSGNLQVSVDLTTGNGGSSSLSLANGGEPGGFSLGAINGISAGDASIQLTVTGGAGGSFYYPGGNTDLPGVGAASGRSVTLTNAITGSAAHILTLRQDAKGGTAGSAQLASAGLAGSASSSLEHTTAGPTNILDVRTSATGGQGGFAAAANGTTTGTPGGAATASTVARNDSGRTIAEAEATGGRLPTASPSQGGAAQATARATGGTFGTDGSYASATATGALGSTGPNSQGGGAAIAEATVTGGGSGFTAAIAFANAGNATNASVAPGAPASATATGTQFGSGTLVVNALSKAGLGPNPSGTAAGGSAIATATGTANGTATIQATAEGGLSAALAGSGQANASGTAAGGTLTADATAQRAKGIPGLASVFSFNRSIAVSVPRQGALASAKADIGISDAVFPTGTLPQALARSNSGPAMAAVTAALAGNATTAARFDAANPTNSLLLAAAGAQAPAGTTTATTGSAQFLCTIDQNLFPVAERKNLQVAFLHPILTGAGPDTVRITIYREGLLIHDVTLAGASAVQTYFTDHVIDFGSLTYGVSGTLELVLKVEVTSHAAGDGFFGTIFVGNAAPAPLLSVDQWREAYFGAGAGNSGTAADGANPSGDGLSNLLKYALGLNPLLAYPAGTGWSVDAGGRYLRLSATRDPNTSGVALSVEGTSDPAGAWSTDGLVIEQNTSTLLQVRDGVQISAGAKRMLRLRATRM